MSETSKPTVVIDEDSKPGLTFSPPLSPAASSVPGTPTGFRLAPQKPTKLPSSSSAGTLNSPTNKSVPSSPLGLNKLPSTDRDRYGNRDRFSMNNDRNRGYGNRDRNERPKERLFDRPRENPGLGIRKGLSFSQIAAMPPSSTEPAEDDDKDKENVQHHALETGWTFWFDRKPTAKKKGVTQDVYESNLKEVGKFDTVETFWRYFHNMEKASLIEMNANYSLFKTGIKPMWEDEANAGAGMWIARLGARDKQHLDILWQNLVLGAIGGHLEEDDEVCGLVFSRRRGGDRLAVWTRSKLDKDLLMRLGRRIKDAIQDGVSGAAVQLQYSYHDDTVKAGSTTQAGATLTV